MQQKLGIQFLVYTGAVVEAPKKVGNRIASILKSKVSGIPARIVLNPVSNLLGLTL